MLKICVIGDIMIDEFLNSTVSRLSPEAPVPVANTCNKYSVPGGAGNVANNLFKLSDNGKLANIYLAGWVGHQYYNSFCKQGIKMWSGGSIRNDDTNIKLRVIDKKTGYHLIRIDNENMINKPHETLPFNEITSWLMEIEPDAVLISDYAKGAINEDLASIIIDLGIAYEKPYPTFVDSRKENFSCFRYAEYITPNDIEFTKICKFHEVNLPYNLIAYLKIHGILLTRGHKGMTLYENKKSEIIIPSTHEEIIDVTGAGDTAISAFLLSKLFNKSSELCLKIANTAAGHVCMYRGTQVPKWTIQNYFDNVVI
jgi:rfaE bifunctional protein kinase chain/domain